jgi:hypothetical protein
LTILPRFRALFGPCAVEAREKQALVAGHGPRVDALERAARDDGVLAPLALGGVERVPAGVELNEPAGGPALHGIRRGFADLGLIITAFGVIFAILSWILVAISSWILVIVSWILVIVSWILVIVSWIFVALGCFRVDATRFVRWRRPNTPPQECDDLRRRPDRVVGDPEHLEKRECVRAEWEPREMAPRDVKQRQGHRQRVGREEYGR